jgi:5S rRNA maturation endonuclease (ribonuclease M5)
MMKMMNRDKIFERIKKWIEDLNEEDCIVLVEGIKDVKALRSLGILCNIETINRGVSINTLIEQLKSKNKKVVILTDWDRTGNELTEKLIFFSSNTGLKYDLLYRKKIIVLFSKETYSIESIYKIYAKYIRTATHDKKL